MKRLLILLSLYCFVVAQYDESGAYLDNSVEDGLQTQAAENTGGRDALLNQFISDAPVVQPARQSAQQQHEESSAVSQNTGTPYGETPERSPMQSGSYAAETAPVSNQYSSSPELSSSTSGGSSLGNEDIPDDLEERIGKTPDIPLFSHRAHIEEVGAECVQCHQTLFAELVRGYKIGPPMKEICGQCHNGETAREEVLAGFSNEKKYVKPTMSLFSHIKHFQLTERCYTCHRDVYGELKKIKKVPPMSLCAECHNNHQANSDCKVCHENVKELKPASHTSRWLCRNGHGMKARFTQDKCSECHAERECDACHRGQSSFAVHRPGYRYAHGMDARQRVANCTYCHDTERSCAQCHMRNR